MRLALNCFRSTAIKCWALTAIALPHDLSVVTRNTADFFATGVAHFSVSEVVQFSMSVDTKAWLYLLGVAFQAQLRAFAACFPPATPPGLHSVGAGCGRCLRGGIGIEQQGIQPGFERGETLVLDFELLRSLFDVVDGSPVEHRQQAPPGRQGGGPFRSGLRPGGFRTGGGGHRRSSKKMKSGAAELQREGLTSPGDPAAKGAEMERAAIEGFQDQAST